VPATEVRLKPWICGGVRKDGQRCTRILMEVALAPGSVVRKICDRCGTVHTRVVDANDHT
jgi:hypothetical protein